MCGMRIWQTLWSTALPTVPSTGSCAATFRRSNACFTISTPCESWTRSATGSLLGFGECFSSKLVNEALRQAGFNTTHVDARSCIVTDANHGQANPLWDETNQTFARCSGSVARCRVEFLCSEATLPRRKRHSHDSRPRRIGFHCCHSRSRARCSSRRDMD